MVASRPSRRELRQTDRQTVILSDSNGTRPKTTHTGSMAVARGQRWMTQGSEHTSCSFTPIWEREPKMKGKAWHLDLFHLIIFASVNHSVINSVCFYEYEDNLQITSAPQTCLKLPRERRWHSTRDVCVCVCVCVCLCVLIACNRLWASW